MDLISFVIISCDGKRLCACVCLLICSNIFYTINNAEEMFIYFYFLDSSTMYLCFLCHIYICISFYLISAFAIGLVLVYSVAVCI